MPPCCLLCVTALTESNDLLSLLTCTFHCSLWCVVYVCVFCAHWCEWSINALSKGKNCYILVLTCSSTFSSTKNRIIRHWNTLNNCFIGWSRCQSTWDGTDMTKPLLNHSQCRGFTCILHDQIDLTKLIKHQVQFQILQSMCMAKGFWTHSLVCDWMDCSDILNMFSEHSCQSSWQLSRWQQEHLHVTLWHTNHQIS